MKKLFSTALVLISGGLLVSCSGIFRQQHGASGTEEQTELKPPPPLHLGAVHQVYRNFALLRIIGPMPEEGTVLISHPVDGSSDRMGNLVVSSAQHRKGNIIAADIRSGWVMKGDRVFRYRSIAEAGQEGEEPEGSIPEPELPAELPESSPLPDFNAVPVVSEVGTNPLIPAESAPAESAADTPSTTPTAEDDTPPPANTIESGIPSKLQDIPDTLEGWD